MKSESSDLRRLISQEQFEKEAVQKTANDLRNMVKKVESDKTDLGRIIQDEKQKNAGEKSCLRGIKGTVMKSILYVMVGCWSRVNNFLTVNLYLWCH